MLEFLLSQTLFIVTVNISDNKTQTEMEKCRNGCGIIFVVPPFVCSTLEKTKR